MDLFPETAEPSQYAVGALCRELERISAHHTDAWLHVFLDLLDKASLAGPSEQVLFALHAALASAPEKDLEAAKAELANFEARLRRELKSGTRLAPEEREGLEVLLVVPKPVEHEACLEVFDCADLAPRLFDSRVRYRRREFDDGGAAGPRTHLTVVCLNDAGNLRTANIIQDYVGAFGRPHLAILCGMAMGLDDTKVELGDVVVAKSVFDMSPRRVTADEVFSRFDPMSVPDELSEDLREHCGRGREETAMRFRQACSELERKGMRTPEGFDAAEFSPRLRHGVILAGETLFEDDSGDIWSKVHDRAYAMEMEGAGFASSCKHLRSEWMVVRGVADYGEGDHSKEWQGVAAAAAASFARSFLAKEWKPGLAVPSL